MAGFPHQRLALPLPDCEPPAPTLLSPQAVGRRGVGGVGLKSSSGPCSSPSERVAAASQVIQHLLAVRHLLPSSHGDGASWNCVGRPWPAAHPAPQSSPPRISSGHRARGWLTAHHPWSCVSCSERLCGERGGDSTNHCPHHQKASWTGARGHHGTGGLPVTTGPAPRLEGTAELARAPMGGR